MGKGQAPRTLPIAVRAPKPLWKDVSGPSVARLEIWWSSSVLI